MSLKGSAPLPLLTLVRLRKPPRGLQIGRQPMVRKTGEMQHRQYFQMVALREGPCRTRRSMMGAGRVDRRNRSAVDVVGSKIVGREEPEV